MARDQLALSFNLGIFRTDENRFKMADPKVVEWEEEKEEEANGNLNTRCYKLEKDPCYHNRMIPVENVRKALLDSTESVAKITSLTEDAAVLNCYKSHWEGVFNAVVKIRVKKEDGIRTGTGFLTLKPPSECSPHTESCTFSNFAVMTNFHVVRQKDGDLLLVEPKNIEVIFFYDSDHSDVVTCAVSNIFGTYSPFAPGKHTDENLDFAMLFIKHPDDEEKKKRLKCLRPLLLDESGQVQAAELPQIADKKRLCVIGHPHGAYKHIAFGELTTNTNGLYQEWKEECKEDFHSVEHSVVTCSGSSGSPVIIIALKNGQPVHSIYSVLFVSFLHFRGDSEYGEAASMQSILPTIRKGLQMRRN